MSNGYEVGYGRPPVYSRFRKGQSGNPGGRPRGAARFAELLDAALDRPAADDKKRRGRRRPTQAEAIVDRLVMRSADGDLRAARLLFQLCERLGWTAPKDDGPSEAEAEAARQRIIEKFDALRAEAAAYRARAEALEAASARAALPPHDTGEPATNNAASGTGQEQ